MTCLLIITFFVLLVSITAEMNKLADPTLQKVVGMMIIAFAIVLSLVAGKNKDVK